MMRLPKIDRSTLPLVAVFSAALTLVGLFCLTVAFVKKEAIPTRHFLLPRAVPTVSAETSAARAPLSPLSPSPWTIVHHGQCCEGNLAAQGSSVYVLLPILVTGNQIWRSDDDGKTWTQKYPPANVSVPFGIEGDLQAFGNDIDFFGTLVAQGISAHSTDRGESWTETPIAVAFPANDQAWSYLGPFNVSPAQTAPYVLTGWYRIGSVALFSLDGGLTWPIQTPLPGVDGSGSMHVVCEQTAHAPTSPGDTRIADSNFANHKAGHYGCWGTDKEFYWTEPANGNLYVCKTNDFGATWAGIVHPITPGPASDYVTSHSGFDNKGTLYVLHGDKLYVSFNQGESFAFVHTLPRWGNALLSDSGADQFFVANCGTIHIGLAEAAGGTPGGNTNIWYLRGSNVDTASPTWDEELVDVVGNDRLDFMQIVLDGNGIPILSYTTPGTEVTTAARNAPMPIVGDTACPVVPVSVVSRKTHGSAGTFDVDLPLTGSLGVECRTGGANGDFQVVITFAKSVSVGGATASSSDNMAMADPPIVTGSVVTVNLHKVANVQKITLTLASVNDGANAGSVSVPMGVLLGDVSGNKLVSNTDVSLVKSQVAAPVTASNFRHDVNANGIISNTDVSTTKTQVGTTIP